MLRRRSLWVRWAQAFSVETVEDYPITLVIPPYLWNGFPQDVSRHMASDSTACCHLCCHFYPYVRMRSQMTSGCQSGPWWVCSFSWPEAMGSGTVPFSMVYHYVWHPREMSTGNVLSLNYKPTKKKIQLLPVFLRHWTQPDITSQLPLLPQARLKSGSSDYQESYPVWVKKRSINSDNSVYI